MNVLLVVGETYCGKGYFISKLEHVFKDIKVIHTGDLIRNLVGSKKLNVNNSIVTDGAIISKALSNEIEIIISKQEPGILVLDNPMKNKSQAESILNMFNSFNIDLNKVTVLWIENRRSKLDYSSRGRIDDNMIPKKIALWKAENNELKKFLDEKHINVVNISNTDKGFLFF